MKEEDIHNEQLEEQANNLPEDDDRTEENTQKQAKASSFSEAIAKQAIEEENPFSSNFSLTKILGGDMWSARIIRKQIWLIVLIVAFTFIYISNRYHVQKDLIEIDKLQKELQDAKYKALSNNSQITEKSRESKVLELLRNNKDSVLHMATQPPYIINVPENEQVQQ